MSTKSLVSREPPVGGDKDQRGRPKEVRQRLDSSVKSGPSRSKSLSSRTRSRTHEMATPPSATKLKDFSKPLEVVSEFPKENTSIPAMKQQVADLQNEIEKKKLLNGRCQMQDKTLLKPKRTHTRRGRDRDSPGPRRSKSRSFSPRGSQRRQTDSKNRLDLFSSELLASQPNAEKVTPPSIEELKEQVKELQQKLADKLKMVPQKNPKTINTSESMRVRGSSGAGEDLRGSAEDHRSRSLSPLRRIRSPIRSPRNDEAKSTAPVSIQQLKSVFESRNREIKNINPNPAKREQVETLKREIEEIEVKLRSGRRTMITRQKSIDDLDGFLSDKKGKKPSDVETSPKTVSSDPSRAPNLQNGKAALRPVPDLNEETNAVFAIKKEVESLQLELMKKRNDAPRRSRRRSVPVPVPVRDVPDNEAGDKKRPPISQLREEVARLQEILDKKRDGTTIQPVVLDPEKASMLTPDVAVMPRTSGDGEALNVGPALLATSGKSESNVLDLKATRSTALESRSGFCTSSDTVKPAPSSGEFQSREEKSTGGIVAEAVSVGTKKVDVPVRAYTNSEKKPRSAVASSLKERLKMFNQRDSLPNDLVRISMAVSKKRNAMKPPPTISELQKKRLQSACKIQAHVRGMIQRVAQHRRIVAAIRIQAFARCIPRRLRYRVRLLEIKLASIKQRTRDELMLVRLLRKEKMEAVRKEAEEGQRKVNADAGRNFADEDVDGEIENLRRENSNLNIERTKLLEMQLHMKMMSEMTEQTMSIHNKNFGTIREAVSVLSDKNDALVKKTAKFELRLERGTAALENLTAEIQYETSVRTKAETCIQSMVDVIESRCDDERIVRKVVAISIGEDDPEDDDKSIETLLKLEETQQEGFELTFDPSDVDDVSLLGDSMHSLRDRHDGMSVLGSVYEEVEIIEEELFEEEEVDEDESAGEELSFESSAYEEHSVIM